MNRSEHRHLLLVATSRRHPTAEFFFGKIMKFISFMVMWSLLKPGPDVD